MSALNHQSSPSKTGPSVAPVRRWTGLLPACGFLALHLAGLAYTLGTLRAAWAFGNLLRMIVNILLQKLFGIDSSQLWWVVPLATLPFAAVVVLGAIEVRRIVRRMIRWEPEPVAGLRGRAALYVAVAVVFVNAFVISTGDGGGSTGPSLVRLPILSGLSVVLAYGVYVFWTLRRSRNPGRARSRFARILDVACMNAVVVLMLAEAGLRLVAAVRPSPLLMTESTSSEVHRDVNRGRPGTMRFHFPLNSGGHYDTEFLPRSARTKPAVVSIGDSYSYGTVPHAFHFTTVAERVSGAVELYNMGFPAIGPSDYLHLLQREALPLEPDMILVNLFLGNDVTDLPAPTGPPRWHDGASYLLNVVWRRMRAIDRADMSDVSQAGSARIVARDELVREYLWLEDPTKEEPVFSRDVYLEVEAKAARVIASSRGTEEMQRFIEALHAIKHVAGNTPLAFVLIPAAFQVEDSIWAQIVVDAGTPLDRDLAQNIILPALECANVPALDLLPILRRVPPMQDGWRHLYLRNDTHFNARGNEVTGRALARFLDSLRAHPTGPASERCEVPQQPSRPMPATVSLPLRVDIGDSSARSWMGSGWNADEGSAGANYAWNEGSRSILTVPLPSDADIVLDFQVMPFVFDGSPVQHITVTANGTVIADVPLVPSLTRYSVAIPAAAIANAVDTLGFQYAYARSPQGVIRGSPDIRALAVAWYDITLRKRGGR